MKINIDLNNRDIDIDDFISCMVLSGMGPDGTSYYRISHYKILDNNLELNIDWIEGKFVSKEEISEYIREEFQ